MKPSFSRSPRPVVSSVSLGLSVLLGITLGGCGSANSAGGGSSAEKAEDLEQPNIVMILLDDLGYTDLGAYGGEVETPHIDAIADDSAQFTDFYSTPLCAPTRAALMTGQDPHRVGLGSMEGLTPPGVPESTPGYKGSLEGEFTGIAEVLGETGYDTYQVGKWHLGDEDGQTPQDLGFDQNFTLYDAGASYFADGYRLQPRNDEPVDKAIYERNGETLSSLPEDFFATEAYTDEMLHMINSNEDSAQPFFGYLAYTAPHDPLHVDNKDLIDQYLDLYLDNYNFEELRAERIQRMGELGLVEGEVDTRWPARSPEWASLMTDQQQDMAYRMAVYAAVIHETDEQIGRIVDCLKENGQYDNTLIVLASDNGASASTQNMYAGFSQDKGWHDRMYPRLGDMHRYGHEGSFPSMALPNAQVASGPFFQAKNTLMEGGIRVPALMKPPSADGTYEHRITDAFAHVTDLYPTFADYAGADLPPADNLIGASAKPLLEGTSEVISGNEFGWEHFGQRAYRADDWKLVFIPESLGGTGDYALYDLATDPGETNDVIDDHPQIAMELAAKWERYAEANGVVAVDFEAVNKNSQETADIWYSIDWAG